MKRFPRKCVDHHHAGLMYSEGTFFLQEFLRVAVIPSFPDAPSSRGSAQSRLQPVSNDAGPRMAARAGAWIVSKPHHYCILMEPSPTPRPCDGDSKRLSA